MFPTFEKVRELARKKGLSLNQVEEKLGYSKNTLYSLKRQKVSSERLQEIADYFNVSTDYLLGRTDNPKIATDGDASAPLDLRNIAAQSMLFDGKPLTEEDIDFITAVLEAHLKNKQRCFYMTVKELCALEGVSLCYFDGSEWHSPGFFNPALKVLAIDINLSEQDQKQVALHELGHKEHTPVQYEINRELCELQADRSMIHHLLEEELKTLDDVSEFNYIHFMERYNLKTIAN